jgi:hypothetical protein
MGQIFDKIVEETRKAKVRGYDWEQYAEGRTIQEVVQDNLADFYIECITRASER